MAVKGKKLKQRIGRWQEYVEQPPALPVAVSEEEASPTMFAWDASTTGEAADIDGAEQPYSVLPLTVADYTGSRADALARGNPRQSTSLQTNAAAAEDRQRLESFERMLSDLEIQLQSERKRAEQLQMQLAHEVMRSRQARMDQRARPKQIRNQIGKSMTRLTMRLRSATASLTSGRRYGNTVSRSRINSVQWIVIVALTAGISSLLITIIANGAIP